jgi:hypothetical protein
MLAVLAKETLKRVFLTSLAAAVAAEVGVQAVQWAREKLDPPKPTKKKRKKKKKEAIE